MEISLTPSMKEALDALTGNLVASEAFIRYHRAIARLNNDPQARALLEQLSQSQAEIRKKQAGGHVSQKEIDDLRKLQEQVQNTPVIMEYAHAQQEAVKFLREINTEIGQLLGIDFASFSKRSGCC